MITPPKRHSPILANCPTSRNRPAIWAGICDAGKYASNIWSLNTGSKSINGTDDWSFSSQHVGGVHFLLMDGSVRFISENTNTGLVQNLANKSDGNVVGEF